MQKVQYYLDETDQIEVDGHTLSRLYLAPGQSASFSTNQYKPIAIYGEDNTNKVMGGYVESLNVMPNKTTRYNEIAWVDENTTVYGHSKIAPDVYIANSTIKDSTVLAGNVSNHVYNSKITASTVSKVKDSVITNSNCSKDVTESVVKDSIVKMEVMSSHIVGSKLEGKGYARRAILDNVYHKGDISGTFSNIQEGDIETKLLYYWARERPSCPHPSSVALLIGPDNHMALSDRYSSKLELLDNSVVEIGDITYEELNEIMNREVDGKAIGRPKTINYLDELGERFVLTDSDLDFGEVERGL